jgi:hypothetical protein
MHQLERESSQQCIQRRATIHGSDPSFFEAGTSRNGDANKESITIVPPIAPNPAFARQSMLAKLLEWSSVKVRSNMTFEGRRVA